MYGNQEERMNRSWEEIQRQFQEKEILLASKKVELMERVIQIFEISGSSDYQTEGFDWFGYDDLLKLNFGGKNVDIKRSVLTKPQFGWNLFSRLFEKRWDAFHVRDTNGRIYVDLKEEWMRPLIDYMKYNETDNAHISPSNLYLCSSIQLFNEREEFKCPKLVYSITDSFVLCDGTRVSPSLILPCKLRDSLWNIIYEIVVSQPHEVNFQFIYSTDFSGTCTQPQSVDMRFKTFAYIVKTSLQEGYTFIFFLNACGNNGPGKAIHVLVPEQKLRNNNLLSIFPIPHTYDGDRKGHIYLKTDPNKLSGDFVCDKLEVYEVKANYKKIIPPCGLTLQENSFQMNIHNVVETAPKKSIHESVRDLIDSLNNKLTVNRAELYFVEQSLLNFDRELTFMANYFHHSCCSDKCTSTSGSLETLKQVITTKRNQTVMFTCSNGTVQTVFELNIGSHDASIQPDDITSSGNTESLKSPGKGKRNSTDCLDPIVYFNVEGEIIPILRSTILRVIPDSQLAVRVSGRWEGNQKDRDEEGNLIVNCHKESFKNILSSLQINPWKKDPLEIYVNELSGDMIEETLDYLMIKPDCIRLIDRTY
jgi:hypothetical protein